MLRLYSLAASRELGGLSALHPAGFSAWKTGQTCQKHPAKHRQWAGASVHPVRPLTTVVGQRRVMMCSRRRIVFAGQRLFCSPPGSSGGKPDVSVVGIPDPLTWIRCRVIMYLIDQYFEVDINSVEFQSGVKQALVHVSDMMSQDKYHRLVGMVSTEMIEYVEKKCKSLTKAHRRRLAVTMDDIIFVMPEDVTVVFDENGRKFCFVVMRFWLLSPLEGPDDPEGTKIFKVSSGDDGGPPQKKIVTAVYEFERELTTGASPDWMVKTVWHWHWKLAE